MEAGVKNLGFQEIQKFWEPDHKKLKLYFTKLDARLLEEADEGKKTMVFVYYTGHGLMDERSLIVVNDDSTKPKNAFMFPLERYIRTISENPNNYMVALFDCCRARVPKKFRNMLNCDDGGEEEPSRNLMFIFGCAPTSVVNQKSPLARAFITQCDLGKKKNGGQVSFPMDFIFFKTKDAKPEIVTDCTHTLMFPKKTAQQEENTVKPTSNMSEALSSAFSKQIASSSKSNGSLTSDTCTYTGDIVNGTANGQGTLKYTSGPNEGDSYTGAFSNNRFHGNGVYTYKQGNAKVKFEGNFTDGS